MKKTLLALLLAAGTLFAGTANEPKGQATNSSIVEQREICTIDAKKYFQAERSGCCSWHGGVSGCMGGRVVCNDGTYSPSCTCAVPTTPAI